MLFMVVGHSDDPDTESALSDVLETCRNGLAGRVPQAGLLFSAIDMDHPLLLKGIHEAWIALELAGCTTDGELSSNLGFREDSVTLVLFGSDTIDITAGLARNIDKDMTGACHQAVMMATSRTSKAPVLCLAFPESLGGRAELAIDALRGELGGTVPLMGAASGDQWRFQSTQQFFGTEVLSDAVPILLFSGPLSFSFGIASGWKPVGQPGQVTQADGPVVYAIDGHPALDFFSRYLGPGATPTTEMPLAILDSKGDIEYLRATFGDFDRTTGSVTYLGNVPVGAMVQITIADRNSILDGCREALDMASTRYSENGRPDAALFFSCAARKLLLGTRTGEEAALIASQLPEAVPFCGFYGYGEISPVSQSNGGTNFHNETFVAVLMGG